MKFEALTISDELLLSLYAKDSKWPSLDVTSLTRLTQTKFDRNVAIVAKPATDYAKFDVLKVIGLSPDKGFFVIDMSRFEADEIFSINFQNKTPSCLNITRTNRTGITFGSDDHYQGFTQSGKGDGLNFYPSLLANRGVVNQSVNICGDKGGAVKNVTFLPFPEKASQLYAQQTGLEVVPVMASDITAVDYLA